MTIVVLLILAGVTINAIFRDNGIIKKAQEASNRMNAAIINEQQRLNELYNELDNIFNGDSGNNTTVDGVIIPDGFYYVGGSKETGIIISDNEEDYNKGDSHEVASNLKGNQFVWIPVDTYGVIDFDESGLTYSEDIDENMIKENKSIEDSIKKYGGFYIGRYETGTDNGEIIVKQGKETMKVTLDEAIETSRNMYNISSVSSTLIHGKQWDAAVNFISNNFNVKDSSQYGNYANYVVEDSRNITTSKEIESRLPIVKTRYNSLLNLHKQLAVMGHIDIESYASKTDFIVPSYESSSSFKLITKLGAGSGAAYIKLKYEIEDSDNIIKNKSDFVDSKELPEECLETEEDEYNWKVPEIKTNVNNSVQDKEATINIIVEALQKENVNIPSEGGWPKNTSKKNNNYNIMSVSNKSIIDNNLKLAYLMDETAETIKITSLSNKPKTTGYSGNWVTNNIYDMAGNNYEWTIEKANEGHVIRGGQYYNLGNTDYIAKRTLENKESMYSYRVVLYLK